MLSRRPIPHLAQFTRYLSNETKEGSKRFLQTIPVSTSNTNFYSGLNYSINSPKDTTPSGKWSKHGLTFPKLQEKQPEQREQKEHIIPVRRSRTSRFRSKETEPIIDNQKQDTPQPTNETLHEITTKSNDHASSSLEATKAVTSEAPLPETSSIVKPKKKRTLRPRKALISLSPSAMEHLRALLDQPNPKLIRIGVRNRGCSGLTYNLEYVDKPGKFDELIEQDDVKVLIDSKALFSIVGSEMDWLDDKLSSRFVFKNPNSKGTCGCGESFMV
jgi:iron-sulfur cluster assembly accessory protein